MFVLLSAAELLSWGRRFGRPAAKSNSANLLLRASNVTPKLRLTTQSKGPDDAFDLLSTTTRAIFSWDLLLHLARGHTGRGPAT